RAIRAVRLIPGLVLDRRRQPDPLVDPLEILFLGDFLLSRNLCVLRLSGTGEIVPIQPRCGNQTGYRAPTSRAALEGRVIHPVHHLVHDQAGRAFVQAPANQVPSPKGKAADTSQHRYVLPKDLPHALKQLDDNELVSLLAAVLSEAKQRDRLRPGLAASAFEGGDPTPKGSPKSNQRSKARQGHGAALSLTRGQVNAVRAAFKAGIGPSRIAREFGISRTDVHKVLASDAGERGRRSWGCNATRPCSILGIPSRN